MSEWNFPMVHGIDLKKGEIKEVCPLISGLFLFILTLPIKYISFIIKMEIGLCWNATFIGSQYRSCGYNRKGNLIYGSVITGHMRIMGKVVIGGMYYVCHRKSIFIGNVCYRKCNL